jgi:hypothetical protein
MRSAERLRAAFVAFGETLRFHRNSLARWCLTGAVSHSMIVLKIRYFLTDHPIKQDDWVTP